MEKTLVEIYIDDRRELNIIKIKTDAKNIPNVLHKAIKLLKNQIENEKTNEKQIPKRSE